MVKYLRVASLVFIVLLLAGLIFAVFPGSSSAAVINLASGSGLGGVSSRHHNTFFAESLYWSFYINNGYLDYKTSLDQTNWSNATSIFGNASILPVDGFALAFDGTNVYVAVTNYFGNYPTIQLRVGEPSVYGNIIWAADWQTCYQLVNDYGRMVDVDVAVDEAGYYWVSGTFYESYMYNSMVFVVRGSSATDGTWTTDANKSITETVGGYSGGSIDVVGYPGDSVAVLQCQGGGYIYGQTWLGSSWSASVHTGFQCATNDMSSSSSWYNSYGLSFFSDCRGGQALDLPLTNVAYEDISGNIRFTSYQTSTFGNDTLIAALANSPPSISDGVYTGDIYIAWENSPTADHVYSIEYNANLIVESWGAVSDEGTVNTAGVGCLGLPGADVELSFLSLAGNSIDYIPLYYCTYLEPRGDTLPATQIFPTTAMLRALITCAVNINGNQTLYGNETSGYLTFQLNGINGQDLTIGNTSVNPGNQTNIIFETGPMQIQATGLVPDCVYHYFAVFHSWTGWTSAGHTEVFTTGAAYTTTCPAAPDDNGGAIQISNTTATLEGGCFYDGGTSDIGGFAWRAVGAAEWNYVQCNDNSGNPLSIRTGDAFWYSLTGLIPYTGYEYYPWLENSLCPNGVVGNITQFSTGVTSFNPITGQGPSVKLPAAWSKFFDNLSASVKIGIAIFSTLGLMFIFGYLLRKSKSGAAIGMGAVAIGMTILFTVISWYPTWIIIFIAILCGLAALVVILGK